MKSIAFCLQKIPSPKILLRRFLTAFLPFLFIPITSAQGDRHLSFELAGSGGLASINWESTFKQKNTLRYLWRVGFSIAPLDRNNGTVLVFPLMVHGVFGKSKHKLDLGIGQSISLSTKGNLFLRTPLSMGYRWQPSDKKYYLRFSYTPLVSYLLDWQWQHWGGITFGYSLKRQS